MTCRVSKPLGNLLREAFKKKNCDYSDIVPISFYTHPSKGDRDSNYRDKINVISTPPLPPVVGTFQLKIMHLKCAKFYKLPANYSREFRVWTPPPEVYVPIIICFIIGILTDPPPT